MPKVFKVRAGVFESAIGLHLAKGDQQTANAIIDLAANAGIMLDGKLIAERKEAIEQTLGHWRTLDAIEAAAKENDNASTG